MYLIFQILKESRRPSESYHNHRFFLKFRFIQLTINAIALFAIASGMTIYFKGWLIFLLMFLLSDICTSSIPIKCQNSEQDNKCNSFTNNNRKTERQSCTWSLPPSYCQILHRPRSSLQLHSLPQLRRPFWSTRCPAGFRNV